MKMAYQPHYNIHYSYPKFHRRMLANLFDFILFVFAFSLRRGSRNFYGAIFKSNRNLLLFFLCDVAMLLNIH